MNEYDNNNNVNNINNTPINNPQNQTQNYNQNYPTNLNSEWQDLNSIGQDNKHNKKHSPKIILLLLLIIGAISGVYCYKNFSEKLKIDDNPKSNEISHDKEENKDEENDYSSPEITNYIEDAKYNSKDLKESYIFYNQTIKVTDIVVPYLNINTSAATEINNKIKVLYNSFIEAYDEYSNENLDLTLEGTESYDYIKSTYTYTIKNDIISILIKVNRTGRGSSEAEEYYTFNYDIKEEKELSMNDFSNKLNLSNDEIIKKVNETIETTFSKTYEDISPEEEQLETSDYIKSNKEYFANQLENNEIKSFIDENNKLNIIVYIEHPFGGCGFYFEFVAITE